MYKLRLLAVYAFSILTSMFCVSDIAVYTAVGGYADKHSDPSAWVKIFESSYDYSSSGKLTSFIFAIFLSVQFLISIVEGVILYGARIDFAQKIKVTTGSTQR